ncbi:hypothetical protein ACI78V_05860 [Geodermatophilus sp. SYSU D00742]
MTAIRRTLLLTAATAAAVAVAAVPAQALFEDVENHSGSVATATVAPPTNVTVATTCDGVSASMTVSWTGSTNARRTGYRVTLTSPGLSSPVVRDTATSVTTVTVVADQAAVDGTGTFVVETLTNTTWTGVSAPTSPVTCPPAPTPTAAPEPAPAPAETTTSAPTDSTTTTDGAAVPQ